MEGVVNPSPEFWRGKRVLLTGHTGFKGAWMAIWLARLGAQVHGFAKAPDTEPNFFELAGMAQRIDHAMGDLCDAKAIRSAVENARPQVVLHLAAQSLVRRSYSDPLATFATNVMGTANLLEALREAPDVKSVVVVTTDKCYENREWVWPYRENDPLGGRDPYSASKACAEIATGSYRDSFLSARGVAIASARAGNVLGGGDWADDRLLPDCMRAFKRGDTLLMRNPAAVRPWQHVLEPLSGYLLLAEHLFERGSADKGVTTAFNFGPAVDDIRPVGWVVAEAARLWGPPAEGKVDTEVHPHEAQLLSLDASKARTTLGWRPRLGLAQCLDWTVQWYREVTAGESALAITESQIDRYVTLESTA